MQGFPFVRRPAAAVAMSLLAFLLVAELASVAEGVSSVSVRIEGDSVNERGLLGSDDDSARNQALPQPARQQLPRKLADASAPGPGPVTMSWSDFCVSSGLIGSLEGYLVGFADTGILPLWDMCAYTMYDSSDSPTFTTPVLNPVVSGTVTQTSIPGGREVSWHAAGSGGFGFVVDTLYKLAPGSGPPDQIDFFHNLFMGVLPKGEGFLQAGLSTEDLRSLIVTVDWTWDYRLSLLDESKPGDPYDFYNPNSTVTFEEFSGTFKGPLRSTPNFQYPLGNQAILSVHARYDEGPGTGPFDGPGDHLTDMEVNLNVLSPTDASRRAGALIAQVTSQTPAPTSGVPAPTTAPGGSTAAPVSSTAAPVGSTSAPGSSTAAPVSSTPVPVGTVGGKCDPYSALPNQCFSSTGDRYVCCSGSCPDDPKETPRCA